MKRVQEIFLQFYGKTYIFLLILYENIAIMSVVLGSDMNQQKLMKAEVNLLWNIIVSWNTGGIVGIGCPI